MSFLPPAHGNPHTAMGEAPTGLLRGEGVTLRGVQRGYPEELEAPPRERYAQEEVPEEVSDKVCVQLTACVRSV